MQDARSLSQFAIAAIIAARIAAAALPAAVAADESVKGTDVQRERSAAPLHRHAHLRRPTALALLQRDQLLLTANRRSGSISVIDVARQRVVAEHRVGSGIVDLSVLPGGETILAIDEPAGQLLTLSRQAAKLTVLSRTEVAASPVTLALDPQGKFAFVASLWARRLTMLSLADPRRPQAVQVFDLPFPPRAQQPLSDGRRLVVADAFGGRLATIDFQERRVSAVHELPGHNLSGLALSPGGDELLVSHQLLNPLSPTDGESVHWGGVMKNLLHAIDVSRLPRPGAELDAAGSRYYLGYPDRAAGDPGALLITGNGRRVVAFAGVNELAISDAGANYFRRIPVGRRPRALALGPDDTVWVANELSDAVSLVDVARAKVLAEVSLGPQPKLSPSDRGELLFYDATLSHDGWFSCHACHTDGHTSGLASDNFGDATYGAPKLTPSLLGTSDTGPWAWNGSSVRLQDQIRRSIEVTMQGAPPSEGQVNDLAAYLSTLDSPPAIDDARGASDAEAIRRGRALFAAQGCADCHAPPNYTTADTYDVGLADELGARRFNPPSLRGVGQRDRLLHDGRTADLLEAIQAHQGDAVRELDASQLADLVRYLRGL